MLLFLVAGAVLCEFPDGLVHFGLFRYLPVCTLLNGGLQVPHCFLVGFVAFALTLDVMQATRKSETVQGRKWIGVYSFFLCYVFFI